MTFLYSAMGILIFSGIMLITKHTLLFSNKNLQTNFNSNNYLSSSYQQIDRYILRIISKEKNLGFDNDICQNLNLKLNASGLIDTKKYQYIIFPKTNSKHPKLINSCVLTNGIHRILIKRNPNDYKRFSFNSCLLNDDQICSFEKN
tara:strand:+ start:44 stop:481 length:438 start_codon:yes stop_codon:yes gene_type:complete